MHPNTEGMTQVLELIGRIERHCEAHGIAESTFGLRAVNDGKFVARLRAGGTLTLTTLERVEQALSAPATPEAA